MARLAADSSSTTRFCMAPPRATSMAVAYSPWVDRRVETGPKIPRSAPSRALPITNLTLPPMPSMFFSISASSWARWRRCPPWLS